ncbi:MAG: hypothetical protein JWN62_1, partial [Acidimicrobiales bacterium]|nr:hypothetical protein [Acidimicrobiales bacterium]
MGLGCADFAGLGCADFAAFVDCEPFEVDE